MKKYFMTGIGTEVGKTVASAVVLKALEADYWKPVQAGELDFSDSHKVARWTNAITHPEAFRLQSPMSPHAAARIDGVHMQPEDFRMPETAHNLIVEGAGGIYVPINDNGFTMLELMQQLALPVIVVSRHYLGSINHTLLSIKTLQANKVQIAGVLFNGEENRETEGAITAIGGVPVLGRLRELSEITPAAISEEAERLKPQLLHYL